MKRSIYTAIISLSILFFSCSKEGTGDLSTASATGQAGSLSKFTIVGNYLYAVDSRSLYTYDITNPSNPVKTNTTTVSFNIETIYPFNNNLFIGSTDGLFIYSIAVPDVPVKTGEASHARSCDPVVANDSVAYVTLKGSTRCGPAVSGLYLQDIRNIYSPVMIRMLELPSPEGLALRDSTLYVCCNNDGLKVLNVSHPENPVVIRSITGAYFRDVIAYNNILICYVSTGIMLYDISDPVNPVSIKLIEN